MLTSDKISSLVIDTLRKQTRGQNIAVIFLYCDYQGQEDQSTVNLIGGFVQQAALRALWIPSKIKSTFDKSKQKGGDGLRLPEIIKLFVRVISSIEVDTFVSTQWTRCFHSIELSSHAR